MSFQAVSFSQLTLDFTEVKQMFDAFLNHVKSHTVSKFELQSDREDDDLKRKAEHLITELESYLSIVKQDDNSCLTVAQSDFLTKLDVERRIQEYERDIQLQNVSSEIVNPSELLLRIYRLLNAIHLQLTINSMKLDDHDEAWESRFVDRDNAS